MNEVKKNIGINVYGYFNELSGLSESARLNVNALFTNSIQVNIKSFTYNHVPNEYLKEKSSNIDFPINLFHININFIENFIKDLGTSFFKHKYNIAYWAWEYNEPPIEIIEYINLFDEIWTPSNFCVNSFNQLTTKPVVKIPHPISPPRNNFIKKDNNIFTFLSVFDSVSSLERKNPIASINAFLKAFKNNTNTQLILKTHNLDLFKKEKQYFTSIVKENKNIKIINKNLTKEELHKLFYNCDAYISLHRSEGFGLTLAEAMSFCKPVIATGYSGNLEFMNINNSFLIPYELTETTKEYGLTKKGYTFADPNINSASEIMQFLVKNKHGYEHIKKRASNDIKSIYSFSSIGKMMKERIQLIIENNLLSDFQKKDVQQEKIFLLKNSILTLNEEIANLTNKVNKYEKNIFIKLKNKIKPNK